MESLLLAVKSLLGWAWDIFVAKEYFRAAARAAAGEYLSTMILCSM